MRGTCCDIAKQVLNEGHLPRHDETSDICGGPVAPLHSKGYQTGSCGYDPTQGDSNGELQGAGDRAVNSHDADYYEQNKRELQ